MDYTDLGSEVLWMLLSLLSKHMDLLKSTPVWEFYSIYQPVHLHYFPLRESLIIPSAPSLPS